MDVSTEIRRLGVLIESMQSDIKLVVEGLQALDQKNERAHQEIRTEIRNVDEKLEFVARTLSNRIGGVRSELKQEIQDVRTELKQEIQDVRTELKQEIQDVRTELKQEIQDVRTELHGVEQRLTDKIDAFTVRCEDHERRIQQLEYQSKGSA